MEDKSLLKVSGIIAIVVGILYSITIVGLIVGIPTIIGGCKLHDISQKYGNTTESDRETILIWTIVFFFINQLSFVFSLIFYIRGESKYTSNNDKYDRLEKIKKLYDEKVLTKQEYEKEKDNILNK